MLRLTPPITQVCLREYRLDAPLAGADLSLPLPKPGYRQHWQPWSDVCAAIDAALRQGKGVLREPWLEFDHPYTALPGVFFRLDQRRGAAANAVLKARQHLMPTLTDPLPWPETSASALTISHCGFFPSRRRHQQGCIRLNLTGSNQWNWLRLQAPTVCTAELQALLEHPHLCWSATFDWGAKGIEQLGFELFPAGHLQRGSQLKAASVQALLQALEPWCQRTAIDQCLQQHHNWHQDQLPHHRQSFSHIKLSACNDGAWAMKLYLISHAAG